MTPPLPSDLPVTTQMCTTGNNTIANHPGKPSANLDGSFRGIVTTVRLSNCLSSGVITLTSSFFAFPVSCDDTHAPCCHCCCPVEFLLPLSFPVLPGLDEGRFDEDAVGEDRIGWCLGAGKFSFLSMASTRRWKRLKRASARMRVDSRSIVPESSFTRVYLSAPWPSHEGA